MHLKRFEQALAMDNGGEGAGEEAHAAQAARGGRGGLQQGKMQSGGMEMEAGGMRVEASPYEPFAGHSEQAPSEVLNYSISPRAQLQHLSSYSTTASPRTELGLC